jgi:acyl-coenzyme A synthetase/AMP-(fatty) acid ligase
VKPKQIAKLVSILQLFNVKVCVHYGMSECGGVLGSQLLNIDNDVVPMGYPLPGVQCLLIDEQGQMIDRTNSLNQIGQLHIGGEGIYFNHYHRLLLIFLKQDPLYLHAIWMIQNAPLICLSILTIKSI